MDGNSNADAVFSCAGASGALAETNIGTSDHRRARAPQRRWRAGERNRPPTNRRHPALCGPSLCLHSANRQSLTPRLVSAPAWLPRREARLCRNVFSPGAPTRRLYLSRSTPPCSSSAWSRTKTAMTMPRTLGRPARRLLVRALCSCTAEARWWLRAALCAPAAPMCTAGARLESRIRCSLCRGSSLCTGSRTRPELQLGHDLLVRSWRPTRP